MQRAWRTVAATGAVLAALALAAGGCGGQEGTRGAPQGEPAGGENTPPSGTPGVPAGAAYDLDGREWQRLPQRHRFDAATAFIDDNPSRCENAEVGAVVGYVTTSYGNDFPLDIAAADVLAEGCDASRQD